jgi:hypothetical protein
MTTKRYYTRTCISGIGFRCNDICPVVKGQMIGSAYCKNFCPYIESHGSENLLFGSTGFYVICKGEENESYKK